MEKVRVLVAVSEDEWRSSAAEILSNVEFIISAGETASGRQALETIAGEDPDVVLIGAGARGEGYRLAEQIAENHPETVMVIIERELNEETMRKAIFSGARDVVVYPFTPARLVDAIYRSYQKEKNKQSLHGRRLTGPRNKFRQGLINVVFSTKGGVGKTFIAVNLAVALQETGVSVALVDLDLDFGSASLSLNVVPRYTISNVVDEIRNLDRDLMDSFLIPHSSGIRLLASSPRPRTSDFINAEHVELILKVLQSSFAYVIVDMPARFYSALDPVFQMSDSLLLVTTPEVSTIRNVKACLGVLDELNYPSRKINLLLNKAGLSPEIKKRDVEATLNRKIHSVLPLDDRLATASLNKGAPVVQLYPRSKISRGIKELAWSIQGGIQENKRKDPDPIRVKRKEKMEHAVQKTSR